MTLRDFRQRGRLGCPKDYEIFGAQLRDLLERIHGASRHVGRSPNSDEAAILRRKRLDELQQELASAIRDEAYEQAAKLRDEIKSLERA
jgi:protein arginine kinase activator